MVQKQMWEAQKTLFRAMQVCVCVCVSPFYNRSYFNFLTIGHLGSHATKHTTGHTKCLMWHLNKMLNVDATEFIWNNCTAVSYLPNSSKITTKKSPLTSLQHCKSTFLFPVSKINEIKLCIKPILRFEKKPDFLLKASSSPVVFYTSSPSNSASYLSTSTAHDFCLKIKFSTSCNPHNSTVALKCESQS